jgi:hypothetical protein
VSFNKFEEYEGVLSLASDLKLSVPSRDKSPNTKTPQTEHRSEDNISGLNR